MKFISLIIIFEPYPRNFIEYPEYKNVEWLIVGMNLVSNC